MKPFSYETMQQVANRLDSYHGVFNQLWSLGLPVMTTGIPTACVWFDDVGDALHMEINPTFWAKQTVPQQDFIVCHECLHVLLSHGTRAVDAEYPELANIAMDIVVNELLVTQFGMDRKTIDPKNVYCWKDKFFTPKQAVGVLETFESYYNHLIKQAAAGIMSGKGVLVDDHSKLSSSDAGRIVRRAIDKLSDEEHQSLSDKIKDELDAQRGDDAGGVVAVMKEGPIRPKPKWESIVKNRLKKMITDSPEESWVHINRRMTSVHNKAILPVEIEDDGPAPLRRQIYLFLDTSGSCSSLAPRFWNLARSIPKAKFDVRPFCFDTKVYDINFKDRKLYGFGGTSFGIIEARIQKELVAGRVQKYPDAVFVVTDGYGNKVSPEVPTNWHVLLTPHGEKDCFPSNVHFYDLSEFE